MTDGLYAALAKFQAKLPHIAKNEKANAGSYSYEYAGIDVVSEAVLPKLAEHGLAFTAWPTINDDGKFVLRYHLTHEAGERLDGEYPLPEKGTPQDLGKAITYARRYSLLAASGAAPGGEDNDAQGVPEMPTGKPRRQQQPQRPPQRENASSDGEGWGDWPVVIDAITSPEDAEASKAEIDKAVAEGRMDDVKAAKIKRAMTIKGNTAARQGGAG